MNDRTAIILMVTVFCTALAITFVFLCTRAYCIENGPRASFLCHTILGRFFQASIYSTRHRRSENVEYDTLPSMTTLNEYRVL